MNLLLITEQKITYHDGKATEEDKKEGIQKNRGVRMVINTIKQIMKHISYLSKLFYQFMYNQTKHKEKKHFCMYCLQQFSSLEVLNKHKTNCMVINGKQAIEIPKKGKNIFRYADFEAITEKVQGCQPKDNKLFTESYQKHTDCVYDYKVVCLYDEKYSKPVQIY